VEELVGDARPDSDQRFWAMLCHLSALLGLLFPFGSLLAPFVIWLLKKESMPYVNAQGKEALNFQISVLLAVLVSSLLLFVIIGFLLLLIVLVGWLILVIVAAINASEGAPYRYPLAIRLIR
jgi:uncharacterized protein